MKNLGRLLILLTLVLISLYGCDNSKSTNGYIECTDPVAVRRFLYRDPNREDLYFERYVEYSCQEGTTYKVQCP